MKFTEKFVENALNYAEHAISMSELHNLCSRVYKNLVKKYGEFSVRRGVANESDSETNNVLTLLVEVGSLKYMQDKQIIATDESELLKRSFAVSFCINIALADVLRQNIGFKKSEMGGYFNNDASEKLAERVFNHHKNFIKLKSQPKHIQDENFTIDEMFKAYLGEFFV
ncbi:MAG: hypothetical protein ACRYFX_26760 [Janthinobacterium lividum]